MSSLSKRPQERTRNRTYHFLLEVAIALVFAPMMNKLMDKSSQSVSYTYTSPHFLLFSYVVVVGYS